MGEQRDREIKKIKETNETLDRNVVRLLDLFEGRLSLDDLESLDTPTVNTMIDEKMKGFAEKDKQMKATEAASARQQRARQQNSKVR